MTELMSVMTFRRGDTTAQELQQIVDEVLAELAEPDSEAARSARSAGVELGDLTGAQVLIREGEQGAEPILTTILVGIAISASSKVAESLWNDILWPRLRRRLGARALGDPVSDASAPEGA
jgi:hypothetical protein